MSRSYALYKVLGGIINEKDYLSVFERAVNLSALDLKSKQVINSIQQAEEIARHAKIEIDDSWDAFDLRIVLYVILRNDVMLAGTEYHHSQMHDQRLFVEALRMLGDVASLGKLIEAYPKISFS